MLVTIQPVMPWATFSGLGFAYDETAQKLSWNQSSTSYPGKMQGSVEFNSTTPVWYVTLELDPGAPKSQGMMIVNGADIT